MNGKPALKTWIYEGLSILIIWAALEAGAERVVPDPNYPATGMLDSIGMPVVCDNACRRGSSLQLLTP